MNALMLYVEAKNENLDGVRIVCVRRVRHSGSRMQIGTPPLGSSF